MATTTQSHDDDFTFPTTAAPSSSSSVATTGFDSPPLWHISPTTSPLHRHHITQCTNSNTPVLSDKNFVIQHHALTTQYTYPNTSTLSEKNLDSQHHIHMTQYTSSNNIPTLSNNNGSSCRKIKSTRFDKNLDLHLHDREKRSTIPTRSSKILDLDLHDHEKMDMLWEDFNEELTVVGAGSDKPRVYHVPGHRGTLLSPKRRAWGAVSTATTMNRSNSGKMIVKVLKTMFLLPQNHHHHYSGGGGLFRSPPPPASIKIKTNRSSW